MEKVFENDDFVVCADHYKVCIYDKRTYQRSNPQLEVSLRQTIEGIKVRLFSEKENITTERRKKDLIVTLLL